MAKTRYAIVGLGSRSSMFSEALLGEFKDYGELVALCDLNQVRMDYYKQLFVEKYGIDPLPSYTPGDFEKMIREQRVDIVIVTSIDRTHHRYIIRGMRAGCDIISEKPMTVDQGKAKEILETIEATGRRLRVTFNYRYSPRNSRVKELLMSGTIGRVLSVHFEWLLDTQHGADYFRRWHRDKRNSGGLLVHKATHHFDLVNWWLNTEPSHVFAMGDLKYYGRENAEERGVEKFYDRGTEHPNAQGDPFALDLSSQERMRKLYLEAEKEDGYRRDQSVFGDCISIEDDMGVLVQYKNGALMTYHLSAYSPWEGYRIAFNGSKGRLEYDVVERSYISGDDDDGNRPDVRDARAFEVREPIRILIRPLWGKPVEVPVDQTNEGGHGGGDRRLLRDLFIGDGDDPLKRAADHSAGVRSIMTGIAANRSLATGTKVAIEELL